MILRYLLITFLSYFPAVSIYAQTNELIPVEQLLKLSPEMKSFVKETLKDIHSEKARFSAIKNKVMAPKSLGFSYDRNANLTASETFSQRRGNCVSFSFMMAALLRDAGFIVYFHSPPTDPLWENYQDQWIQETHMNLLVRVNGEFFEIDIFPLKKRIKSTVIPLTDTQAFARYYCNQGVFLLTQNQTDKAKEHLIHSLKLDKSYSNIWQNLGIYYRKTKDYPKALDCLKKASHMSPQNEAIYYLLSKTSRRLGNYEDTEIYRKKMRKVNPKSALYFYACAEDALADETPLIAQEYLSEAITLNPNCHLFYKSLARAYGMEKNYQKMLDSLQQARDVSTTLKLQRIYTNIMQTAVKFIHSQSNKATKTSIN